MLIGVRTPDKKERAVSAALIHSGHYKLPDEFRPNPAP
jgi:hypothetical protein